LVAKFSQTAKGLDDIAAAMASRTAGTHVPAAVDGDMNEVAESAREVLHAAEPDGKAGAGALSRAVADAAHDVVRHLVMAAGGRSESPSWMVLDPSASVAFSTDVEESPPDSSTADPGRERTKLGKVEAREGLQEDLRAELVHFVYVALLAHSATRDSLAPRRSPHDLPAEVPDLNLPVANRKEWQEDLFDPENRLIVPSPSDSVRWRSFIGWVRSVNPALWDVVDELTSQVLVRIK
jgi:hypothetical protein